MASSVGFPQSLGHDGEVYDPLVAITFPVVSYLVASLNAHLRCLLGDFFVAIFSVPQSTWG